MSLPPKLLGAMVSRYPFLIPSNLNSGRSSGEQRVASMYRMCPIICCPESQRRAWVWHIYLLIQYLEFWNALPSFEWFICMPNAQRYDIPSRLAG